MKPKLSENIQKPKSIDQNSEQSISNSKLKNENEKEKENEDEDEEDDDIDILEFIPSIDIQNSFSIDNFKKRIIQLILEFQIESPEAFATLNQAAKEKNQDIDERVIDEMFQDIEDFIQHYNDGNFDSSNEAEDDFEDEQ